MPVAGAKKGAAGMGGTPYIGRRYPRVEDPTLIRGAGRFVDDIQPAGLLEAAFLRSPVAHGLIRSVDATAARADLTALAGRGGLEARYWLGVVLERGEGGAADPVGAVRWYVSAANEGEPHAALALGRIYLDGEGAAPNLDRAYEFFSRAQARGMPGEAGAGIGRAIPP